MMVMIKVVYNLDSMRVCLWFSMCEDLMKDSIQLSCFEQHNYHQCEFCKK